MSRDFAAVKNATGSVCDDWTKGSVWRHVKSGRVYSVIGTCRLEATNEPAVLYASPADGIVWARDRDEFLDGRFERIEFLSI